MLGLDGLPQQSLQPVPRRENLGQMLFGDNVAGEIERDPLVDRDAKVFGACAARFQRRQQFGMGRDAGAAADQFYA